MFNRLTSWLAARQLVRSREPAQHLTTTTA
jgi:hypothetical protein